MLEQQPVSGAILRGTTVSGGRYGGGGQGAGTVFELTPASGGSWKERLLWQFDGGDGQGPRAGVSFDSSGNLYGTTAGGGATCEGDLCGTLFKLTQGTGGRWVYHPLYGFRKPEDGFSPSGGVVFDKAGNLYGTTELGGIGQCYDGCGVAYELTPRPNSKWKYTVLYKFCSPYESPSGGTLILDAKGNLYSTALSVVYEITP